MHLIFHAGRHKTGTTTFQCVLSSLKAELLHHGIHVPVVDGNANMSQAVVHPAQKDDWSGFDFVLDEAQAALGPEGVVLFSAEDLENCLVDTAFGRQFMHRARSKGVTSIRWVFVHRNEFEYFESLYGELSKHRQTLHYERMANDILEQGFFSCATPQFRWHFDFRHAAAVRRFQDHVCGHVSSFEFPDFLRDGIGSVIFALFDKVKEYRALCSRLKIDRKNRRLEDEAVERNYAETVLGLGEHASHGMAPAPHVDALVAQRLETRARARLGIKKRFDAAFGAVEPVRGSLSRRSTCDVRWLFWKRPGALR